MKTYLKNSFLFGQREHISLADMCSHSNEISLIVSHKKDNNLNHQRYLEDTLDVSKYFPLQVQNFLTSPFPWCCVMALFPSPQTRGWAPQESGKPGGLLRPVDLTLT